MHGWENLIFQAFAFLGGTASLQDIYCYLEKSGALTEADMRSTRHGGRPAYQHGVRSYVSNLHEAGKLTRVSRGRYRLT